MLAFGSELAQCRSKLFKYTNFTYIMHNLTMDVSLASFGYFSRRTGTSVWSERENWKQADEDDDDERKRKIWRNDVIFTNKPLNGFYYLFQMVIFAAIKYVYEYMSCRSSLISMAQGYHIAMIMCQAIFYYAVKRTRTHTLFGSPQLL